MKIKLNHLSFGIIHGLITTCNLQDIICLTFPWHLNLAHGPFFIRQKSPSASSLVKAHKVTGIVLDNVTQVTAARKMLSKK